MGYLSIPTIGLRILYLQSGRPRKRYGVSMDLEGPANNRTRSVRHVWALSEGKVMSGIMAVYAWQWQI